MVKVYKQPTCDRCKHSQLGFDSNGVIHAYCKLAKDENHISKMVSPPFPPDWCPKGYNSKW